jgi:NAD(P)-dependent dehydrogenase (short-subunit alcohol dehydrogenase family)
MRRQGLGGDIVYIASKNAIAAGPKNIAYASAKASQAHQVRLLAAELGEHGIRVNGINPDGVVRGSGIFSGGWGPTGGCRPAGRYETGGDRAG